MKSDREITFLETVAILVSSIIGVGILPLPLFAVRAAGSGAPLVTLLGSLLGFVGLVLLSLLGKRFPRQTLVQYSEVIIGKWTSWVGSTAIILFFGLLTAFAAREFGEVVITSVLKNTPVEVTVIVMLILAAISSRHSMTTFAYIHYFYLPFLLVPAVLIVILSLKNADYINLQPNTGSGIVNMVPGIFSIGNLFQSSFILSCVIPAMRNPNKALKASAFGILIAGGLYVAIVAATVGVFGAEETKLLLWPTLELAKTTSLPANVLERLDAAFLAVWVTAVFTTLYSTYTLTIVSITNLFRLRDYRMLSFFYCRSSLCSPCSRKASWKCTRRSNRSA
ncbi:endospore germination permease [Cohnella candidum]|uniref:GerAB/ArcD/ProY family transporter n=1 Tax=Cohnella candidum TaxID=2674991 RepID=UPI0030B93AD3